MKNQKKHFKLPKSISYLNTAYMAATHREVEKIGKASIALKSLPHTIKGTHFFEAPQKLCKSFGQLIDTKDIHNIAIVPSVSYALANAANNVKLKAGDEILMLENQFPSNVYPWIKVAKANKAKVKFVKAPTTLKNRGKIWNKKILKAINKKTAIVAMPHIHWADGTLFDLMSIRLKTRNHDALLMIDGTQSVGALPFSIKTLQPDVLVCAGYKWLMGPYSIGLAYYGDYFKNGEPIENNWINRLNSEDFGGLVNYQPRYRKDASRYSVGESSNFSLVPMLAKSLKQINKWGPKNIQNYCDKISKDAVEELRSLGCFIDADEYRSKNLFGIRLPKKVNLNKLKKRWAKDQVIVSYRGDYVRVSPHVYNDKEDFVKLVRGVKKSMK